MKRAELAVTLATGSGAQLTVRVDDQTFYSLSAICQAEGQKISPPVPGASRADQRGRHSVRQVLSRWASCDLKT